MDRFDCVFVLKNGTFAQAGTYSRLLAQQGADGALRKKRPPNDTQERTTPRPPLGPAGA